jgi:septal ring factor EnvC (AmiA/AmiB activator)
MWSTSKTKKQKPFVVFLSFLFPLLLYPQTTPSLSRTALEKERNEIEQQIQLTEQLISRAKQSEKEALTQTQLLSRQIKLKENLLKTIERERQIIESEMEEIQKILNDLQKAKRQYQKNLARTTYLIYREQAPFQFLLWVFSASSFRESYNRIIYFNAFREYRQLQIELLKRTYQRIHQQFSLLEAKRKEKLLLSQKLKKEKANFEDEKNKTEKEIERIKKETKNYKSQLSYYKEKLRKINKEIDRLIKEEIARAQKEKRLSSDIILKLSNVFHKNKGRLPWPIPANQGVITGFFGKQKDPSGGYVINNGIYITTSPNQQVRAVFNGQVSAITSIPTLGKVVILQHGEYRTVYAHLSEVFVQVGEQVKALHPLGTVKTDPKTGESMLHFLIYHQTEPEDPLEWIVH